MKILITGAKGQLGNELISIINSGKAEIGSISNEIKKSHVIGLDINELNITDIKQVKKALNNIKPDIIINCAAATNVDECEKYIDSTFRINSLGARNLAIVAENIGAKFIQISTDYVFSGLEGKSPFREFDLTNPYSIYGKTKLEGERFVREICSKYFIVRTAWLYGYVGHNFVYTIRKLGLEKEKLTVVNDQVGNPTNANDLAYHILKLIETEEYGVYHCTGNGECTWYDFAKKIIELSNINCEVIPCTSKEFKTIAKRPEYSSLDNMMLRCTVGDKMRNWEEAIESFIKKIDN